ncbi:MAG: DNA-binding domain-containing protein [Myxococcota bacterium]
MNLVSYQEAVARVCFDPEPASADLRSLGHEERWLTYRRMVRARIERVLRTAFPKSVRHLGDGFDAHFRAWLAETPPTTPLFRNIPLEFAGWLAPKLDGASLDRFRFERLSWELKDRAGAAPEAADLSFDAPILLSPHVALLVTTHLVHKEPERGEASEGKRWHLLLYRNDEGKVVTMVVNGVTYDLVTDWLAPHVSLADSIRKTMTRRGETMGEAFMESLGGLLADYLQRGIVLGSGRVAP